MGHQGPLLDPGLGAFHNDECLVAGPLPMEFVRAQPDKTVKDPLPVGSPPAGEAIGVRCSVSWVAAEGKDLGGLIPG